MANSCNSESRILPGMLRKQYANGNTSTEILPNSLLMDMRTVVSKWKLGGDRGTNNKRYNEIMTWDLSPTFCFVSCFVFSLNNSYYIIYIWLLHIVRTGWTISAISNFCILIAKEFRGKHVSLRVIECCCSIFQLTNIEFILYNSLIFHPPNITYKIQWTMWGELQVFRNSRNLNLIPCRSGYNDCTWAAMYYLVG